AEEEEQLVLPDRAPDSAAVRVVDELRDSRSRWLKERPGGQPVAQVIAEGGAVQLVCAALDVDVDRGAASQSLRSIIGSGDDGDALDRIQTRGVAGVHGHPGIGRARAVDARVVRGL